MPLLTTRDRVLATAPELAGIPYPPGPAVPDVWGVALEDAARWTRDRGFGEDEELAQRLFVAHTLVVANPQLERRQAVSFTAGSVSKTMATTQTASTSDEWWLLSRYGKRLQDLVAGLLGGISVLVT